MGHLEEDNDLDGALANSQLGINNFEEALQAMEGQQNVDKYVYMVHDMWCTDKGI